MSHEINNVFFLGMLQNLNIFPNFCFKLMWNQPRQLKKKTKRNGFWFGATVNVRKDNLT
jgi:hypothetical protein